MFKNICLTNINIQIVVGRLGWKWIERSVLQLLLLKQKEVELLYIVRKDNTTNLNRSTDYCNSTNNRGLTLRLDYSVSKVNINFNFALKL